jgi:hypothetical protein
MGNATIPERLFGDYLTPEVGPLWGLFGVRDAEEHDSPYTSLLRSLENQSAVISGNFVVELLAVVVVTHPVRVVQHIRTAQRLYQRFMILEI